MIKRIINYYDSIQKDDEVKEDKRELYFNYFEELSNRNFSTLRKQNIIKKEIDCERNFEKATNYIFEMYLNQKPLNMIGNEHPDGTLSYGEKLILWDNKSKETKVNLKDHIKQFDRYIIQSKKMVVSFIVIAPSFTEESVEECINYQLLNDTVITLITASDLKNLAVKWKKKNKQTPFPLGYFKQPGRFNVKLVKNI